MTWKSEYRPFTPTWQCTATYCLFNFCKNPRSVLRESFTSAVFARTLPQKNSSPVAFIFLERSKWRCVEVHQVWRRGTAGGAWMSALSDKRIFFGMHAPQKLWNTFMKANGDYKEKLSNCVPLGFNKLRDKNI